MKQLFIFNETSHGSVYGIGTYISQLIRILKDAKIELFVVNIRSGKKELEERKEEYVSYLYIPNPIAIDGKENSYKKYYRQVTYLLGNYIKEDYQLYIFYNYIHHIFLNRELRTYYPVYRTFYIIHYQNWALSLFGNIIRFKKILSYKTEELTDIMERKIKNEFELELSFYNKLDHIICLSYYTRELLLSCYELPQDKVLCIPNGLAEQDCKLLENSVSGIKKKWGFPEQQKIILFVGRLDPCKGTNILLEAFRMVVQEESNCRLVLAGAGDYKKYLPEIRGMLNQVTFLGKLNKEDLYEIYRISYAGILPSYTEQCSYVAIEMMMFGIPMIITANSGLNEMGKNGITCMKIPVKEDEYEINISSVRLKELILEMCRLPVNYYSKMCDNSRQIYETCYSEEIMKKRYIDLILNKYR